MTAQEIDAALRSLHIGWDRESAGLILEDAPTAYCNTTACKSYARIGTDAGVIADDLALALYSAEFESDPGPLAVILQAARDARTP